MNELNLHWQTPAFGKAVFRAEPEDFFVEEILGHEPDGEGEFLLLFIEKRLQNTHWVAEQLAKKLGLPAKAATFSGRKDRHAVTRQWIGLHLINKPTPEEWLGQEVLTGCTVLSMARHRRKLRLGQHKKNRFRIRLREIEGVNESKTVEQIEQKLMQLKTHGMPNYFGEQRFGHEGANLQRALNWLQTDKRPRGRTAQSMALSSLRSWLFNEWLAKRESIKPYYEAIEGECFILDGANSSFVWEQRGDEQALNERLQTGDIHPSLPLAGEAEPEADFSTKATLAAKQFEQATFEELLAQWPLLQALPSFFAKQRVSPARRATRVNVDNFSWQWQNGGQLELYFELATGSFATALLGECFELVDASHT